MKKYLIAGNWKMNMLRADTKALINGIIDGLADVNPEDVEVLVCPPFTNLGLSHEMTDGTPISLGAQNMHFEEKGAFTGEISPKMLLDCGCKYVILGHSERRQYFKEDNELLTNKLGAAFGSDLIPIYCIGETLDERKNDETFRILEDQLSILSKFNLEQINKLVIAYEPVWAIGTGLTASKEQILEVHAWIADYLQKHFGAEVKILYGGSMNAKNAVEILSTDFVSGGLIGGASLDSAQFLSIINDAIGLAG